MLLTKKLPVQIIGMTISVKSVVRRRGKGLDSSFKCNG